MTRGAHGIRIELALDLALEVVAALLVDQVPLVVGDDQRAAGLDHHRDDPDVLLGQRLARVDEDDGDLGLLQRGLGAQRRVVLVPGGLVRAAADAGGVDEPPGLAAELDQLVDRVDGGAGDRVDDDAVLPGELVEQAGLADVGLAEQRDATRADGGGEGLPRRLREGVEDGVEQVAAPPAVQGGDRVRLPEAEVPRARRLGLGALVVDLVRGQHDRLPGLAQHLDDRLVGVGDADRRVDDEQDGVGGVDGELGLGGDAAARPCGSAPSHRCPPR